MYLYIKKKKILDRNNVGKNCLSINQIRVQQTKPANQYCDSVCETICTIKHEGDQPYKFRSETSLPKSVFLVACTALQPALFIGPSVHNTLFFGIYGWFLGYCSCPTAWLVHFIFAPAHPHVTWVALYPALLFC